MDQHWCRAMVFQTQVALAVAAADGCSCVGHVARKQRASARRHLPLLRWADALVTGYLSATLSKRPAPSATTSCTDLLQPLAATAALAGSYCQPRREAAAGRR